MLLIKQEVGVKGGSGGKRSRGGRMIPSEGRGGRGGNLAYKAKRIVLTVVMNCEFFRKACYMISLIPRYVHTHTSVEKKKLCFRLFIAYEARPFISNPIEKIYSADIEY